MPRPNRSKKKPPIEISDEDSTSTFSPPSPSPSLFRIGEKRGHPQSSPEKENQKPAKKIIKPTITDSTANTGPFSFSPEQHLSFALESLTQAYIGLEQEEEKEEKKEQVKQLVYYTRSILLGENPFIQEEEEEEEEEEKENANDVLKGLVEEIRALRKEVAPIKETYAERLKKDLPSSSSSLPYSSLPSPTTSTSTSTRSKKKQLQERKLVLITDEKD